MKPAGAFHMVARSPLALSPPSRAFRGRRPRLEFNRFERTHDERAGPAGGHARRDLVRERRGGSGVAHKAIAHAAPATTDNAEEHLFPITAAGDNVFHEPVPVRLRTAI